MDGGVALTSEALSDEQREWCERICAEIDRERLRELLVGMVEVASPTGDELALARHLVERARSIGLEARLQHLDDRQANVVLHHAGSGGGAHLLLYAPIDTHMVGAYDDLPWAAPQLRADMLAQAECVGDYVIGLGANNPKGHAACVIAAIEAAHRASAPLVGSLSVGLGAGGMPINSRRGEHEQASEIGHGRGVAFMLERGVSPDFAIIAKTNWSVAWEEVGLAWFRIRVHGSMNYTGVRHFVAYDNPILTARTLIDELEGWFPKYTARNTSGLVAPQASIGAIEGGWTTKPTFSPAACDLYLDVRVSPRTSLAEVEHQLEEHLEDVQRRHGLRLSCQMVLGIPGSHTDPESWIVRSAMRAWEALEGRPHEARANQSGATDANVLRRAGVPTARIGMPRVPDDVPVPNDFSRGMNVASVSDMEKLARYLVLVVVDTCMRRRSELGL